MLRLKAVQSLHPSYPLHFRKARVGPNQPAPVVSTTRSTFRACSRHTFPLASALAVGGTGQAGRQMVSGSGPLLHVRGPA